MNRSLTLTMFPNCNAIQNNCQYNNQELSHHSGIHLYREHRKSAARTIFQCRHNQQRSGLSNNPRPENMPGRHMSSNLLHRNQLQFHHNPEPHWCNALSMSWNCISMRQNMHCQHSTQKYKRIYCWHHSRHHHYCQICTLMCTALSFCIHRNHHRNRSWQKLLPQDSSNLCLYRHHNETEHHHSHNQLSRNFQVNSRNPSTCSC